MRVLFSLQKDIKTMKSQGTWGQVRVGTRTYNKNGSFEDPSFPGFVPIVVMTKSNAYSSLDPYELFDERGRCLENLWQAARVYEKIPDIVQKRSRHDQTVIWRYEATVHALWDDKDRTWSVQKAYCDWRRRLQNAKEAVRYPAGFKHKDKYLFSLNEDENGKLIPKPLDDIEARKIIYIPLYERLVQQTPQFKKLKDMVKLGVNVLLIEIDGPRQESLEYYTETYGVPKDFINRNTMLATRRNLDIMLNDDKHPYGHGYCLARLLI